MAGQEYGFESEIEFDSESIEKVLQECEKAIDRITPDETSRFKLKFAVQELLVNALEHGYEEKKGSVSIHMSRIHNMITLDLCDKGTGISFSKLKLNKDISNLDEAKSRGWGLSIINKLADSIEFASNTPSGTKLSIKIYE